MFGEDEPVALVDVLKVANDKLKASYGDNVKTIGGGNLGGFIDLFTETRGQKADREAFLAGQNTTTSPIQANPLAKTLIAEAIEAALNNTQGQVKTPDGLIWEVTKTAFNKMIAATNKDGDKAYQRERIIAIQQLSELASHAKEPLIRHDDGQDEQIDAIYEYQSLFEVESRVFSVRLLCKKWKNPFKNRKNKMHSLAMDDAIESPAPPASQEAIADGMLIDLELVVLDGKEGAASAQGLPDHSPSADNDLSIAQSDNKSTETDPNVALLQDITQGQYSHLNSEALLDVIEPAARAVDVASYATLINEAEDEWLKVDNRDYALDSVRDTSKIIGWFER